MGLQCSRQGYIKEFECYGDKRLAPEGECHLSKDNSIVHSKLPFSSPVLSHEMTSSRKEATYNKEIRESFIIGEENNKYQETKFVDLPPECSTEKDSSDVYLKSYYVELPAEEEKVPFSRSDVNSSDEEDCCSPYGQSREHVSPSSPNDKKRMEEKENLQELKELVESICSVIGIPMHKDVNSTAMSNLLKKQLSENHEKVKLSSPSKYSSSRHYKGMIFPPPNSEEAEKVSSYIEEKINSYRLDLWKKELRKDPHLRAAQQKFLSKSYCHKDTNRTRDECYVVPKRSTCSVGGDTRTERTHTVMFHRQSKSHSSSPSDSQEAINLFGNQSKSKPYDNYKMRLRHSCSCHRRRKGNIINIDNNEIDEESNLCKQIKTAAQLSHTEYEGFSERHESRTPSIASSSSSSCSQNSDLQIKRKKTRSHNAKNSRPDVWPGQCAKGLNKCAGSESPIPKQSCFCKRMLGSDYHCNHIVTHS